MYAIIADGGNQYKVEEGQELEIQLRDGDPGDQIVFDEVLVYAGPESYEVGKPTVTGAKVTGSIVKEAKGPKIKVLKFRRRKDSKTLTGHRQRYTVVRIDSIAYTPAEG